MYKTTQSVFYNEHLYDIGEIIENPTTRMKDLGIVILIDSEESEEILLLDDSSSISIS